ncbi:MAG: hypothetical protein H0U71_00115 [Gammaproteobacteria bacterium]|nr:hypothetical protein [Gammaproteobacteria bacterium]
MASKQLDVKTGTKQSPKERDHHSPAISIKKLSRFFNEANHTADTQKAEQEKPIERSPK